MSFRGLLGALLIAVTIVTVGCSRSNTESPSGGAKLLNVSYDPTREFYAEFNKQFESEWQKKSGKPINVSQSHGGSGKQARAVIDGLATDVVTLAIPSDVNAIQKAGLIEAGWEKQFPNNSSPYTSTIVFVVRRGNPKGIKDWPDLVRPGVAVLTPNPKTSGGARCNYLAAWGYALKTGQDPRKFVSALFHNVPILDSGARAATTTFVQRGQGDVLIAWENEAMLIQNKLGKGQYEIVTPSISFLAEPPVAVVDKNVDAHHTRDVATAYLQYLYSPEGQALAAKYYYRPRNTKGLDAQIKVFPKISLFNIDMFGGWEKAQKEHFCDGGTFDQIYAAR